MQDDTSAADILMGDVVRLEDVLSRDSVTSVSKSFFALFGLPVRVISHEGDLLADVHRDRPLCNYLNTLSDGERECANTVGLVRDLEPQGRPSSTLASRAPSIESCRSPTRAGRSAASSWVPTYPRRPRGPRVAHVRRRGARRAHAPWSLRSNAARTRGHRRRALRTPQGRARAARLLGSSRSTRLDDAGRERARELPRARREERSAEELVRRAETTRPTQVHVLWPR